MEMYTNSSSFKANLTLERRNSFRDVSFSSYLNKAEENMVRTLANQAAELPNDHHNRLKPEEDEEIGVFGAEKYFKGEIEDGGNNNDQRFIDTTDTIKKMHQQEEELEEFDHDFPVKVRTDQTNIHTPSVRSNVSRNSRSRLLTKQSPVKIEIKSKTRNLLARFGCNCMNKKSTQINDKRFINTKEISKKHTKMLEFDQKTDKFSTKLAELNTRNDYFTFPVLNSNDQNSISSSNSKSGNLAGKTEIDNNGCRLKKITLLNDWDMDIRRGDEMYITSSRMYNNNDVDSDSSSDLFEIESFSPITGDGSFLGHRKSESNGYAPSEVSVDWSVVTASAADFSVVSDYDDVRTGGCGGGWRSTGNVQITDERDEKKKRAGVLSGCVCHKAVRVARDEYKVSGGGGGGGGGGGRRRLSESMAVGSMFRGGDSLTRKEEVVDRVPE